MRLSRRILSGKSGLINMRNRAIVQVDDQARYLISFEIINLLSWNHYFEHSIHNIECATITKFGTASEVIIDQFFFCGFGNN